MTHNSLINTKMDIIMISSTQFSHNISANTQQNAAWSQMVDGLNKNYKKIFHLLSSTMMAIKLIKQESLLVPSEKDIMLKLLFIMTKKLI